MGRRVMDDAMKVAAVGATVGWLAFAGAAAGQAQTLAQTYEAAKAEGEVSIIGPPMVALREELTKGFSAAYPGITVSFHGMMGGAPATKMKAERAAGIFATDAVISGTDTGINQMKPERLIRPFADMIVDPDAMDPKKWLDGGLYWSDKDQTVLVLLSMISPVMVINTDMVKPGELTSDKDLLDPRWKGKIAANDPLVPGNAGLIFRRFYELHGLDYLKKLNAQDVVVSKDLRQVVDWVAKGRYAIGIGVSPATINQYQAQGVKTVGTIANWEWKDPMYMTAGFGDLFVPEKAAHPNAAKLFVNWLLTRDGQLALSRGIGYPSRRLDVPVDHIPEYLRVRPGIDYVLTESEEYRTSKVRAEVQKAITEIGFGRR
ncbi:MAG: ABC transporter substrate-binding protein [Alphaproteobacteria bacterium]